MSNQNQVQQAQPGNQLMTTMQIINSAPNTRAVLEIEAVQKNWVASYEKLSGKKDGAQRFEAEKIMFLQLTSASNFKDVDKFSMYSAFIELAISGLTLRDGISYVYPYGKKAQFMPSWKGRLEQITDMPDVIYAHEPQVVREGDLFDMELGMSPKINMHKPGGTGEITHVYFVIDFQHGSKVYFMTRDQVLNIRNRRSKTFQSYMADCEKYNQAVGNTFSKPGQYGDQKVEPPMWVTDEEQAFKKTIVRRTYNTLPKLPKQKWLDDKLSTAKAQGMEADADDLEENNFDDMVSFSNDAAAAPAQEDPNETGSF